MSDPIPKAEIPWYQKCASLVASVANSGGRSVSLPVPHDCSGPAKVAKMRELHAVSRNVFAELPGRNCIRQTVPLHKLTDGEVSYASIFLVVGT